MYRAFLPATQLLLSDVLYDQRGPRWFTSAAPRQPGLLRFDVVCGPDSSVRSSPPHTAQVTMLHELRHRTGTAGSLTIVLQWGKHFY
jgi:hypothetical protein